MRNGNYSYPSGAGGIGNVPDLPEGHAPWDLVTQDPRLPILTRANGARFGSSKRISTRDVAGIVELYGLGGLEPTLHQDPKSTFVDKFRDAMKKRHGCV